MKLVKVLIFATLICYTSCAKILGVFPFPAYSHFSLGFTLMKELADRGHEVTFINPYPQKEKIKNWRDISTDSLIQKTTAFKQNYYEFGKMTVFQQLEFGWIMSDYATRATLSNKNVQELLHSNETFDLVVMETLGTFPLAIFAHKSNCPLVQLVPTPITSFNKFMVANPYPTSYVPNLNTEITPPMTFWQRTQNTFYSVVGEIYTHWMYIPGYDEILKEFVNDAPKVGDMMRNTSMMLVISHPSLSDPMPLQANVKEIGGYHVAKPKELPKDIKEFMDNATEGVVLFSMGSNLKSSDFPQKKIDAILKSFGKIKQKVLWKFENDLPGKPDNVKIMNWLPQNDILAHPNTKAFIGHGGLLSTTEAVYHGVPMIGVPVFWDQKLNIKTAALKGYAVSVPFVELDEENFTRALDEILNNPKYRTEMKRRSKIMHSDPMKQMDSAIFWLEYVMKTDGARHLRSPGMDLNWIQINLIDVVGLLVASTVVIFFITYFTIKKVFLSISKVFRTLEKSKMS